ncbi:hypothetical protein N7454_008477 [Penicillium verhagenii]|nr:hypothetical protein N7454_008477 [Penicillium verhagenii]
MTLKQPYHLTKLHEKHGSIVRYGPDKLSITDEEAIKSVYQSGARVMTKTEFYDAYGAAHPNVFGMRDETDYISLISYIIQIRSIRRRQMSHSFPMSYVKEMEQPLDANIEILRQKISSYTSTQEVFDLKKMLNFYVIGTLGELHLCHIYETA